MNARHSAKSRHAYRDLVLSERGPSTATARLVAVALTMRMDASSMESFASAELLAKLTALSERTVRTALGLLKSEGWIEERNKERGRNFWLKYRRAVVPPRLAEESAGSQVAIHPAESAGTRHPAISAGHPANGAGLPADNDTTPCKNLQGDPAAIADDPVQEITEKDPEQDPGRDPGAASPSPASAGSAAQRRLSNAEILAREEAHNAEKRRQAIEAQEARAQLQRMGVILKVREVAR